ncbi:putative mitochondrial outer membrane beta-barrel protein [Lasiosphaeria hispida]|uniref:Mitochondrial outer membrane beta-barrel protein n=1 Tax=Lasiosphaeria hispida TaxID=260671 RepID=A0AAJ0MCD2_9PEZI|nr:putative mitochondrial outer membrane beta-barrel protein [Lasiosphaeria hispida]
MANPIGSGGSSAGASTVTEPQADPVGLLTVLDNALAPASVHSIEVHGAKNTRRSLLDHIFNPIIESSRNPNTTLGEVTTQIGIASGKLSRLGIFREESTRVFLADAPRPQPGVEPTRTELDVSISVKERGRFALSAGTDFGNSEGTAFTNAEVRNILGGAEKLTLNARVGTRTRSAYNATLSAPVNGNPDVQVALEALKSSAQKPWASHDEHLTGGSLKLALAGARPGDSHSFTVASIWRQLTGLGAQASPTVRHDAGDSVKNSLGYSYLRDRFDRSGIYSLPQSGHQLRIATELAGWGPLQGDVSFSKTELEFNKTLPGPKTSGIIFSGGLRLGLLYPLPFGYSLQGTALPSRINDRFQLGGPTDVRGFKIGGLGPHDGSDAVGGDVFAAGGINMLFPLPLLGADSPLRLQLFANSGRLVALKHKGKSTEASPSIVGHGSGAIFKGVQSAVSDLVTGLPSTTAGFGLVYAHPVARFELNFSLPLVMRRGEEGRKGLQFGVGINFL